MIIDTSALIAIASGEPGWEALREALFNATPAVPATVLTELYLVTGSRSDRVSKAARDLLSSLIAGGAEVVPFEHRHAEITVTARDLHGKGNGRGGVLNFGDLMVYAIAKERGLPLLCTGRDFASTDLDLHPASRIDA